jgi:hypothetical protein
MGFFSLQSKFKEPVRIDGSFKGRPPLWFGAVVFGAGLLVALKSNGSPPGPYESSYTSLIPKIFVFCVGLVFMGAGAGLLWVRHAMKRCVPAAELGARYSAEPDTVTKLATERGVRPRFIVNGQSWYNPEDLGDAMTLLRPATQNDEPNEMLLRPARASSNPTEQLLRSSSLAGVQSELPARSVKLSTFEQPADTEQAVHVGGKERHE